MRRDSRLSVALHILLHMAETSRVVTSEQLGPMLKMNPVLVRRTIAGLRDAGIVRSEKGHGGGWILARALDSVTLADVYDALGITALFSIGHREERPRCLLEQAVNRTLDGALEEAQTLLLARLKSISVMELAADVHREHSRSARKGRHAHA
jgi:DNA-binding IscR family transcriptional regulator